MSRWSAFEVAVVAGDVAMLAADHPERRGSELSGDLVRLVRQREPHRLGQERVAGEKRDAFAELDVRARAPTPLVVVVQRGQVVVDERERVDELERCGSGQRIFDRAPARLGDREAQHGANTLAARLERVAESVLQARRAPARTTSAPRYVSTPSRSSSAGRIGQVPCARQLTLDLPSELGELGNQLDGGIPVDVLGRGEPFELVAALVERPEQLLGASQRLVDRQSRCLLLTGDAGEDAVDEPRRILRRVALRQYHGLVDRDLARHRLLLELVHADAQDIALERPEAVGRPVRRRGRDAEVERRGPRCDRLRERAREVVGLAFEERRELLPGEVPLVEKEQRLAASSLAARRSAS